MAVVETEIDARCPAERPAAFMLYARAFAGLFLRDLHVLRREMPAFLVRVVMNPLLFLFVFTYIMPHMSGGAAMNPTASMQALPGLIFRRCCCRD